jgi:hypothetical protein
LAPFPQACVAASGPRSQAGAVDQNGLARHGRIGLRHRSAARLAQHRCC